MNHSEYIEVVIGKRSGKACLKGTRISVYDVLSWLASGMSTEQILMDFPELSSQSIRACLAYAADREHHSIIIAA